MKSTLVGRRAVLGSGLLAASVPFRARAQQADSVRIGVLNDQNGPYADSGGPGSVVAARMAVQDFGGASARQEDRDPVRRHAQQAGHRLGCQRPGEWYDSGLDAITDLPVTPIAAAVQQIAREQNRTVMIAAAVATEFTSKTCSPVSSHWVDDTHSMVSATTKATVKGSSQKWFFITVDYTFGRALQAEATGLIEAAGGKVIGSDYFPLGGTGLLFSGREGAELGRRRDRSGRRRQGSGQPHQAGCRVRPGNKRQAHARRIPDLHHGRPRARARPVAGPHLRIGLLLGPKRAVARFRQALSAERKTMPSKTQAGVYTSTLHFLKRCSRPAPATRWR